MIYYQVQIRNQKTGIWYLYETVKTEYEYELADWHFMFWVFKYNKITKTKFSSDEEKRIRAKEIADELITIYEEVRIIKVHYDKDYDILSYIGTVWMNGQWCD